MELRAPKIFGVTTREDISINKTEKKFRALVEKLYNSGKSVAEIRDAAQKLYPEANKEWLYNKCKKAVYKLQGRYSNGSNPRYKKRGVTPEGDTELPELGKITTKSRTRFKNNDNLLAFVVEGKEIPSDKEILDSFGLSEEQYEVTETTSESHERYYVSLDEYRPYTKCRIKISQRKLYSIQKALDENVADEVDYSKVKPVITKSRDNDEERYKTLEIDLADFHYGLRAISATAGEEYSCAIAEKLLFQYLQGLADDVKGTKFKNVIFATLGDFLHVDNGKQTTTSGTFQQLDGDIYNVGANGGKLMIRAIEFVKDNIDTPTVEYIHVQGNHDREIGTMIGNTVEAAFRKDDSIICDVVPNPNKIRIIAGIPVIYCHGDIKNISELFVNQFSREYLSGTHPTARIHAGHIHNLKIITKGKIVVKNFPTICGSSIWEHQQGYGAYRALGYTIYNEKTGSVMDGYIYDLENE